MFYKIQGTRLYLLHTLSLSSELRFPEPCTFILRPNSLCLVSCEYIFVA